MAIRAVIFDFGGVLYNTPNTRWLKRWQAWLGLRNDAEISAVLTAPDESDYMRKIYTGEIPEAEVWQRISTRWRISPWLFTYLRKNSLSKKRFNQPVGEFLRDLRPAYKTAILSNAGDQGRQWFSQAYQLEKLVDLVVISAEEKLAKPDKRIYQLTLDRLGVLPEEAVFVDDLEVNVQAARSLGMRAVRFDTTAQALGELRKNLSGNGVKGLSD